MMMNGGDNLFTNNALAAGLGTARLHFASHADFALCSNPKACLAGLRRPSHSSISIIASPFSLSEQHKYKESEC